MKTEIICIIDRSGSMASIERDVVGGYERFIKDQKEQPGEARITLIQFDDKYEKDLVGVQLANYPGKLSFCPRGATALFDAIGRTLDEQGKRIAKDGWADLVIVNIITDGGENASCEMMESVVDGKTVMVRKYSQERVKEMTAHAEKHGWKFLFLAANQDAFAAARSFGSSGQYAGNFKADSIGTQSAYASMSATSSLLRSGQNVQSLVQAPDSQDKKTTLVPGVAWPSK